MPPRRGFFRRILDFLTGGRTRPQPQPQPQPTVFPEPAPQPEPVVEPVQEPTDTGFWVPEPQPEPEQWEEVPTYGEEPFLSGEYLTLHSTSYPDGTPRMVALPITMTYEEWMEEGTQDNEYLMQQYGLTNVDILLQIHQYELLRGFTWYEDFSDYIASRGWDWEEFRANYEPS